MEKKQKYLLEETASSSIDPTYEPSEKLQNHKEEIFDVTCCSFCRRQIFMLPLQSMSGEFFCDIICAKLYQDLTRKKLHLDKHQYDVYCKNDSISENARCLYENLKKVDFELLPTFNFKQDISRLEAKREYMEIFNNYLSKM